MKNVRAMRRAAVAASCVLVLSACSGDDEGGGEGSTGPAVAELPGSGAQVLVAGPTDDAGQERITGKPVVVNGCLGAETTDKTFLVVWPSGTALATEDGDGIRVGDHLIDPDTTFVGTGTLVFAQPFPEQFPSIPLRCLGPAQEAIAWVQEVDEVTQ